MTDEERRKLPEHHVVHDYGNLLFCGRVITDRLEDLELPDISLVRAHIWQAFYMNCRKMCEFFKYKPKSDYLRAQQFVSDGVRFTFNNWTSTVQKHMEIHLLHVGGERTERDVVWNGDKDEHYLSDFENAWELFLRNLKDVHKTNFRNEIDHRLRSGLRGCGSLGKQFIL